MFIAKYLTSNKYSFIDTPDPKALLSYLRDCLAEERARAGIPSLFAPKIRSRRLTKDEEKISFSEFGSLDLPPSELSALTTSATLLQRNTDLFYSTIVIASQDNGKTLHTPVLLYPIEIREHENEAELRIDHSRVSLNPALNHLFDLPPAFESKILSLLPTGELNLATPGLIAKDLAQQIPHLDTTPFENFPKLLSAKEAKSYPNSDSPALLALSALLLVDKSKNVAGLLHELDDLLTQPTHSYPPALHALLGQNMTEELTGNHTLTQEFAPALLSPAQSQLLRSATNQPLTVCHGPPGTGKSFTISATALDQVARGHSVLIANSRGERDQ